MLCDFGKNDVCRRCGRVNGSGMKSLKANCRAVGVGVGVGDRLSKWLASIGITPASYRRWKVRWGLADACNCGERKEKLNRFGRWLKVLLPAPPRV